MELTFVYLDFPFWRAEVGRISLFCGNIDFQNRIISREEFQRVKRDGCLDDSTLVPFHQFPLLIVDGTPIVQTGGIIRFCGKLSGMYPKHNDLEAAQIDQFIDFATDITVLVFNCGIGADDLTKRTLRHELANGELTRKLDILEKNLKNSSEWILGDEMGLPDIAFWRLMGWLSSGMLDGMPTDILGKFPKLMKICQSVDNHPKIKEWVEQTYPQGYVRGNYTYSKN